MAKQKGFDSGLFENELEGLRRGWDSGLDFIDTYQKILSHLNKTKKPQDVVLLIQLRNGSRVGEAVEALREFCATGRAEVLVRVEKHKDVKDQRVMVLPEQLRKGTGKVLLEQACTWVTSTEKPKDAVKVYCRRAFGFNTHSLRYAFITYMLKKGVSPSVVAKITGHSSLESILHYTETKTAQDLLRELP